jgi:tartronate-semialdehyde synthase
MRTKRTPSLPVMEASVNIPESEGGTICFGVHGAAILPPCNALSGSNRIRHMTMRHEEETTHAADGWARATGKVALAIGTSGPAGTNMATGLCPCKGDPIHIVCTTGQAANTQSCKWLSRWVNIAEIVKPLVGKSYGAPETAQIPDVFHETSRIESVGHPDPILIYLSAERAAESVLTW